MRPRDNQRLFDNRRRFRCQAVSLEIARIDQLGRGNIGSVVQYAAKRAAEVVNQHVVIAYLAFGIEEDAIEDVDDGSDLDLETGLFDHFSRESGLQRLPQLQSPAWEAPLPR